MPTPWRKYEILILMDPNLGTEGTEDLINRCRGFVIDAGGRMLKTERWGIRDTAFEVKRQKKAWYLLLEFAGEGSVATSMARQLNLLDVVIKFQAVKLAEGIDPSTLPEIEEQVSAVAPSKPPVLPDLIKDEEEEEEDEFAGEDEN
ncbi:30S ribosomal protein S6 [bacterium]|nr:MAG: 30S ribosomal protein S6 [bacterium]